MSESDNELIDRRAFLRRSATAAVAIPLAGGLLAACRSSIATRASAPIPLARPDRPVAWPLFEDNAAIASGLPIERGATLKVFEWRDYLARSVLDGFAKRLHAYDVGYEVSSFEDREEALARIAQPGADFDVFFPTVDQIGVLVEARLLRPLNHDYLPNLANLWPQFAAPGNPFYDRGLRYTTPYTVFGTGIGWRADLVRSPDSPDAIGDPFDIFWNPKYRGRVGLYDSYREGIGMALLRDGAADVNTSAAPQLWSAGDALVALAGAVHPQLTTEGAYEGLPKGEFAVHQAWSGDMLSAPHLGRADALGTTTHLKYAWPAGGIVGCDLTGILSHGKNPVLAHAFLNHLLDVGVAARNFEWNGYQPPLSRITRDTAKAVPVNLLDAILSPADFQGGRMLLGLTPAADAGWRTQWDRFVPLA